MGLFRMGLFWFGVVLVWDCFGLGLFWFGVVLVGLFQLGLFWLGFIHTVACFSNKIKIQPFTRIVKMVVFEVIISSNLISAFYK